MNNEIKMDMKMTNMSSAEMCASMEELLDQKKAEDIIKIPLAGKSSMADYILIASGTSSRHIKTLADLLKASLHQQGISSVFIEGISTCDWVLVDAGDVIVHLFRPEVREFYSLEKMWGIDVANFARQANQNMLAED